MVGDVGDRLHISVVKVAWHKVSFHEVTCVEATPDLSTDAIIEAAVSRDAQTCCDRKSYGHRVCSAGSVFILMLEESIRSHRMVGKPPIPIEMKVGQ